MAAAAVVSGLFSLLLLKLQMRLLPMSLLLLPQHGKSTGATLDLFVSICRKYSF